MRTMLMNNDKDTNKNHDAFNHWWLILIGVMMGISVKNDDDYDDDNDDDDDDDDNL